MDLSKRPVFVGAAAAAAFGLLAAFATHAAGAEELSHSSSVAPLGAPRRPLEFTFGNAYMQGFGRVASTRIVDRIAGAGFDLSLSVDARLTSRWSIGLQTGFDGFTREQNSSAGGLSATLGATYSLLPALAGNPWLRFGAGYRRLWEDDPPGAQGVSVNRHALEVASLQLGCDVRLVEGIAIAPMIGGDLDLFVWEDDSQGSRQAVSPGAFSGFVLAGLAGRFAF